MVLAACGGGVSGSPDDPALDGATTDAGALPADAPPGPTPAFVSQASVSWDATVRCTHDDGTTESYPTTTGERWDQYGPVAGDVVAGALERPLTEHTWRLER